MVLQPLGLLGGSPCIAQARQRVRQVHADFQAVGLGLGQRCQQPGRIGVLAGGHEQARLRLRALLCRGRRVGQLQRLAR